MSILEDINTDETWEHYFDSDDENLAWISIMLLQILSIFALVLVVKPMHILHSKNTKC